MKYHWALKLTAIVLACVAVVGVIAGGACAFFNLNYGLYYRTPDEYLRQNLWDYSYHYSSTLVDEYAFQHSGIPQEAWDNFFSNGWWGYEYWHDVDYTLRGSDGNVLASRINTEKTYVTSTQETISIPEGTVTFVGNSWDDILPTESTVMDDDAEMTLPATEPHTQAGDYGHVEYYDTGNGVYKVTKTGGETSYQVELFFTQEDLSQIMGSSQPTTPFGRFLYSQRFSSLAVLAVSLILLLGLLAYLCAGAGRKPGSEQIRPTGLNRMPLDLYVLLDGTIGCLLCAVLLGHVMDELFRLEVLRSEGSLVLLAAFLGITFLLGLICALFWCALCAQVKVGDRFWIRNTLIGRCWGWIWGGIWNLCRKCISWLLGLTGKVVPQVPKFTDFIRQVYEDLPLKWQWLTISLVTFLFMAWIGSMTDNFLMLLLYLTLVAICCMYLVFTANNFGKLRKAAKQMSQGHLEAKIDADSLDGSFRDFALDLNTLGDVCKEAAREQLKSERMKSELITNVSHDIKTPLTSIINYVDLLQMAGNEDQRREYLQVLERQSLRLKKLIEDLMEMSKASSGNVAAEISPTDLVEAAHQALGEFSDRMAQKGLKVVFRTPEEPVMANCDGKLLWRVLSNVLNNVVKYAMTGTRVYVDLEKNEFNATISLKNISAESLNISAEELMERFVRGDESRNTEGNGLGLNIARGLMEVQQGKLDLVVDGDLFKVILTLPRAE